jgi:hypothetical protein
MPIRFWDNLHWAGRGNSVLGLPCSPDQINAGLDDFMSDQTGILPEVGGSAARESWQEAEERSPQAS